MALFGIFGKKYDDLGKNRLWEAFLQGEGCYVPLNIVTLAIAGRQVSVYAGDTLILIARATKRDDYISKCGTTYYIRNLFCMYRAWWLVCSDFCHLTLYPHVAKDVLERYRNKMRRHGLMW